jgi:hypothetical protein
MSKADDDSESQPVVQIERGPGKWRYTCPRGHTDWRVVNHVLSCATCRRHAQNGEDVDPRFTALIDQKTGEEIPRERVEIILDDSETIKW